jgi:photosystem II stability/assembly factor-like uncharacterized protein
MARTKRRLPLWLVMLGLASGLISMSGSASAQTETSPAKGEDEGPFKELKYRSIGPAAGGRVCRVAGVPGNPLIYFAATASGGVWQSLDGGLSWKCVTEKLPTSTAGSIAVAPSDPNVVYMGSGEANIRNNVVPGNGIYKSTDGGSNWTQVWKQDGQIGTMVVHPRNPDVAFAAVLGKAFGPSGERGVYRTTDGGKTWVPVLKKDQDTGASDVALDPSNPNIVFAGLWQTRRRPWELTSGGPGSGLYISRDGGTTWKQLTEKGLPKGLWGKIGVAVAPSDGRRVYALIEAEKGGLFRSDDGGETWSLASGDHGLRQRAWYYSTLTVDPKNPDVVWCPSVPMLKSIDRGKTFQPVRGFHHGDHHDIWIDPTNPRRIIDGNDGGVDINLNGGETWYAPPLPISQFYRIGVDSRNPYHIAGTMQDLGSIAGPSNSLSVSGIALGDWYNVGGGETGYTVADPTDPDVVYAGEYAGVITRYDHRTRQARTVSSYVDNPSGHGAADMKYRFRWPAPIAGSPHDPKVIYHAANVLFRTADGGQTWTPISPDLTCNDKRRQQWSGGPITGDNTSAEYYCTISAVAESPREKGLIWVGSDDGRVHLTRDAGKAWTDVTDRLPGLPEWATIKMIEPSPFDAAVAYLIVDAHMVDDMHPYLYRTRDHGKTWALLSGSLPQDIPLHVVREAPKKKGMLYVGTERGVAFSTDDGKSWQPLQLNLPTVPVHDLIVKNDDLVLGTHGRSLWIFDDLTPIRTFGPAIAAKPFDLLPALPAVRWRYHGTVGAVAKADNPPAGAILHLWLKDKPKARPKLEIFDADGKLVRAVAKETEPEPTAVEREGAAGKEPAGEEQEAKEGEKEDEDEPDRPGGPGKAKLPDKPGLYRVVWDLEHDPAKPIKEAKIDAGNPETGPLAVPGKYTAKLTVDGQAVSVPLEVLPDPRAKVPPADRQEQVRLALSIRDDFNKLSASVERLRAIRSQLQARNALIKEIDKAKPLAKASTELITKLDTLEAKLHNPKAKVTYDILAMKGGAQLYSNLGWLYSTVLEGDGPPTQGMRDAAGQLSGQLGKLLDEFQVLIDKDLDALNQQAKSLDLPHILVPAVKSQP